MFDFLGCTIHVEPQHMSAVVRVESSANPYAIGVVGHYLSRQPKNVQEALEVVNRLVQGKYNYSVGLSQVNQTNFAAQNLTKENMFDKCANLEAGSLILKECHDRLKDWTKAYSCYYSGDAVTGFRHGYVNKVLHHINSPILTATRIPQSDTPIEILPRKVAAAPKKRAAATPKTVRPRSLRERRLASPLTREKT